MCTSRCSSSRNREPGVDHSQHIETYQVWCPGTQLYDIEDRARDLTPVERQLLRHLEAVPILDRIETYLNELSRRALPKSALGKVVTYARNQWAALRRYVSDGRLTIDNNVSERTVRLQAIGRKNWEFLGSAEAGPRAAVLFTILAGAKRHCLEPSAYVRDVLLHLSAGETELEPLLPDQWAAAHPEQVLQHRIDESRRKAARRRSAPAASCESRTESLTVTDIEVGLEQIAA